MEKILVFDTHRAYARLFKQEFSPYYEVNCCTNNESFNVIKLKEHSFAITIIHEYEELVHVIPFIQNIPNIVLGSKLDNIEVISKFSENIMFMDLNVTKQSLISELENTLSLFSENPPDFHQKYKR
uniref:hypothetical protein n=1 Tax=Flavobacterium sp. TaxID=239 RepID=UPI0040491B33